MNDVEIIIDNQGVFYNPLVEEGITWETEREGTPGKLEFKVVNDKKIDFQEGNPVILKYKGNDIFYGFVFKKSRDKEQIISVTAYDQLRYLKNKDRYNYKDKTTNQLIQMLAEDFNLKCGILEDTVYPISHLEDNTTLFDMILYSMQETTRLTGNIFIFYDDFGKLTLKNLENMKLDCLISENTAQNFKYESSIDGETYNKIKLVYENSETKKREIYITKDTENINKWGVLQKYETINKEDNGALKADVMLKLYNQKRRSLTINGAFGDIRVRGGSLIPVILTLGDIDAKSYLMVTKVKHKFNNNEHTMDLTLRGDVFV